MYTRISRSPLSGRTVPILDTVSASMLDLFGSPLAARVTHILWRLDLGYVLQDNISDAHNADDRAGDDPNGRLVQKY